MGGDGKPLQKTSYQKNQANTICDVLGDAGAIVHTVYATAIP